MKIHCKKILSLLLAICMLLTLSPVTPVTAEETATATNETTLSATEEITETDALADVPAIDLTADCAILNYVDEEVFASGNHVLRLHDEETLSSYVFLNADGTKTVYYLDEAVKFVDNDGAIQEKDVTLALSGTAYTTTRNDISLSIPTNPTNGITLIWKGHAVRIIPQGGTLSDTVLDGNSIRYTDYYGEGMDLVYTPTLAGVKEDIVLESYTGQNVFTFMLNTGGLNLYSTNGRYYLAESKTATDRIELGDLVTFDANGRFSVGTMTSQTISAGNIYRLTLKVDEDFLTDPDTVYPVSIDPELSISDNTHGSGAIEDVNIYEGTPNATANWSYMHVGYYDSTYKRGRILVRLTGLLNHSEYQSMSASQITSATFHLKEATGKAAANIQLRVYNGSPTWTETGATWNNTEDTFGTLITTVSHGRSIEAEYDITALVKGWKEGTYNEDCGFLLCHASEATATKGFYSSEYSSDTSYRPYVTMTYNEIEPEVYIIASRDDVDVDDELQLTAITSPSGKSVTWSTSNSGVATVVDGLVTGEQIGEVSIIASLQNGNSDSKTIYVTIADGVYRIKNKHSNLYLSAEGMGVVSGTDAEQQSNISTSPDYLTQRWKITHLSSGYYSIRPMHKLNLTMTVTSAVVELGGISTTDSISAIPINHRWKISYTSNGYLFHFAGNSTQSIYPLSMSTSAGTDIMSGTYTASSKAFYWSLENVTSQISNQLIMRDLRTDEYVTTAERYIAPGESLTLSELGLSVAFVSKSTNSQSIRWSSSSNAVTVNSTSGAVVGVTPSSTVTITASITYSGSTYTRSYTLHTTAIPEGTYYIRNRQNGTYMEIDSQDIAPDESGAVMELNGLGRDICQKWEFTLLDDGYYSIISAYSGLALSVQSGYVNVGNTTLVQEDYTGADRQKWDITLTSDGSCILRPKSGSNWCMAAASNSTSDGIQVQQRAYSNDTVYTDEWWLAEFGVELAVPQDGQMKSCWCWVACARMLSTYYYPAAQQSEQCQAVEEIKGNADIDEIGTTSEIVSAIEFFTDGSSVTFDFVSYEERTYSEDALVQILDDGDPVIVCTYRYSDTSDASSLYSGHAIIIYGYAVLNGEYRFLVHDPLPVRLGQSYMISYDKLYSGTEKDDDITVITGTDTDNNNDPRMWHSIVVLNTTCTAETQPYFFGT